MFAAQPGAPAGAQVVALWDPQRREGALHLAKLPEPGPDKDYQLWIITPESKQPLDAGVIPAASDGRATRQPGRGASDLRRAQRRLCHSARTRHLSGEIVRDSGGEITH